MTHSIVHEISKGAVGFYAADNDRLQLRNFKMAMVFCRGCGKQIHESAPTCPTCGATQGTREPHTSDAMKYLTPVGRSGWAIAAGYLGLFSILVFPAPFAIVIGMVALRDISKNPTKLGKPRAIFGILMGCFGLLEIYLLRHFSG